MCTVFDVLSKHTTIPDMILEEICTLKEESDLATLLDAFSVYYKDLHHGMRPWTADDFDIIRRFTKKLESAKYVVNKSWFQDYHILLFHQLRVRLSQVYPNYAWKLKYEQTKNHPTRLNEDCDKSKADYLGTIRTLEMIIHTHDINTEDLAQQDARQQNPVLPSIRAILRKFEFGCLVDQDTRICMYEVLNSMC